jgi:uncharacterized protein (TIGR02611 family)
MTEHEHRVGDHDEFVEKVEHVVEEFVEEVEGAIESALPWHLRLQAWGRRTPARHTFWRGIVLLAGLIVVAVGLLTSIPGVPGPGLALIFLGVVILSSEFAWAHRLREPMQRWIDKCVAWFKRLRSKK